MNFLTVELPGIKIVQSGKLFTEVLKIDKNTYFWEGLCMGLAWNLFQDLHISETRQENCFTAMFGCFQCLNGLNSDESRIPGSREIQAYLNHGSQGASHCKLMIFFFLTKQLVFKERRGWKDLETHHYEMTDQRNGTSRLPAWDVSLQYDFGRGGEGRKRKKKGNQEKRWRERKAGETESERSLLHHLTMLACDAPQRLLPWCLTLPMTQ